MKKIKELLVSELRKELEERDLDTTGKKVELQERLSAALIEQGQDPNTFFFNTQDLGERLDALREENSRRLDAHAKSFEALREENTRSFEVLREENTRNREENAKSFEAVARSFEAVDRNFEALKEETSKSLVALQEDVQKKVTTVELRLESLEKELSQIKIGSSKTTTTSCTKGPHDILVQTNRPGLKLDVPIYDGQVQWETYLSQFKATAKANAWTMEQQALALVASLRGPALNVLPLLSDEEKEDFGMLSEKLEVQFGSAHKGPVHRAQLKARQQKSGESLQDFEADIARLTKASYPDASQSVLEQISTEQFVAGLRDLDIQQAVRWSRPKTLLEALTIALEIEATKPSTLRGQARVRATSEEGAEEDLISRIKNLVNQTNKGKGRLRCWNCGEVGHLRRECEKLNESKSTSPSEN